MTEKCMASSFGKVGRKVTGTRNEWVSVLLAASSIHPPNFLLAMSPQQPSPAFIGASWVALVAGLGAFIVGLWNAQMLLNEKGYYFTILMYGLFSAISLQK